jgi:hypothetical protein
MFTERKSIKQSRLNSILLKNNFCMLKRNMCLIALFGTISIISIYILYLNRCFYRFPGLFYFEPSLLGLNFLLLIIPPGLQLQFNLAYKSPFLKGLRAASVYLLIINLISISTTAIQYTPYPPIDKEILYIEQRYLNFDLKTTMDWLGSSPSFSKLGDRVYRFLIYEVFSIPLLLIYFKQYRRLYNFYFMILFTWLIGSLVYYYFPTTAPASVIDSLYFSQEQYLTGLKFWQLHHFIQPVASEGGMISMPSFHVIWALLFVYLLRPWPIIFCVFTAFNSMIILFCVLLGWHYLLDVIASVCILLFTHYFLRFYDNPSKSS